MVVGHERESGDVSIIRSSRCTLSYEFFMKKEEERNSFQGIMVRAVFYLPKQKTAFVRLSDILGL